MGVKGYRGNTMKTLEQPYNKWGHRLTRAPCIFCLLISSLFYLTATTNTISAATYYVDDANGNDASVGDSNHPWKTLTRAMDANGKDPNVSQGDTVYFYDGNYGTYSWDARVTGNVPINNTDWITYKAAPWHIPEINNVFIYNTRSGYANGNSYTCFDGFRILNGISAQYDNHLRILNCTITRIPDYNASGVYTPYYLSAAYGIYTKEINDVSIIGNTIYNTTKGMNLVCIANNITRDYNVSGNTIYRLGGDGIAIGASDINISDNYIYDMNVLRSELIITGTKSGDFTIGEEVTQVGTNATGVVTQNPSSTKICCFNTSSQRFLSSAGGGGTITGASSGQTIIPGTSVDGEHADGIECQCATNTVHISNVSVERNRILCAKDYWLVNGGVKLGSATPEYVDNVIVRNNLVSGYQILLSSLQGNITISNNTFDCFMQVYHTSNDTNCIIDVFYNNIVRAPLINVDAYGGITNFLNHGNNIFGNNPNGTGGPSYPFAVNGTELINTTPAFVDVANGDFRLKRGSIAIDFGNPSYAPATDIRGYPRDAQPDAGCYEYANLAPIANNQIRIIDVNVSISITLVASDFDGDTLTYSIVTQPSNGTLSGTAPNLSYKPNSDYKGTDSFTFKVNDGTHDSNIATVTLIIKPVTNGPIAAWGRNDYGQADPCDGNDFVAISAGVGHSLALRKDGSIVAWGQNDYGQADPCDGNDFVAISAGGWHSLALKQDGSIVVWGQNDYGQADPCAGNDFIAIAAGTSHNLALKNDGSIVAWGRNDDGQADPCAGGDFIAIAAGTSHNLALKQDGSIVAWGRNDYGQADPCDGNDFAAIAAGGAHSLALKKNGSVVAWGRNDYGQADPPDGNDFVAIAAGDAYSLALKEDGSIVAWGQNDYGQADPYVGHNFFAISAGGYHGLAIMRLDDYQVSITKCTVTAGSKENSDKISFSGTMDPQASDFNDANAIEVIIDSNDIVDPCVLTFPIDANTFKKGDYRYSKTVNGVKKVFKYYAKNHKFAFSVRNIDLSGLSCPGKVQIEIGDSIGTTRISEALVNGPKRPIPIKLMMGVKDVLRVETPYDKCQVKHGKKPSTDQLSVKGAFAVEDTDVNLVGEEFVATLGTQTFTMPAGSFKAGKDKFTCTKAVVSEGGSAAANFNLKEGSFTLTIKNTVHITATGDVKFGIAFADYDEVEQVTLPP